MISDVARELLNPLENHRCLYTGPTGPESTKFMRMYADRMIRAGITSEDLPESGLISKIANRICGPTKKDVLVTIQGKKGSGKSTIAVGLGWQLAKAYATRRGGTPTDYFNYDHVVVLGDSKEMFQRLEQFPEYSIIILDDLSIAANSRQSQSSNNIGLNNIVTISRTKRWTIITTSPLRTMVDKSVRLMSDVVITTYHQQSRVDDKPGYNIVRCQLLTLNPATQKEMTPNFNGTSADGEKVKVKYYVVFYPPAWLIDQYNDARDAATSAVIRKIATTGEFNESVKKPRAPKLNKAETVVNDLPKEKVEALKGKSKAAYAAELGCSPNVAGQIKRKLEGGI